MFKTKNDLPETEPIETSSVDLIFGSRKLEGAPTGDPATADATLRFSARPPSRD